MAAAILVGTFATVARAHEARPAYLELVESKGGRVDLLWKRPARGEMQLAIQPVLPAECRDIAAPRSDDLPDAAILHRSLDCGPDGLAGREISIEGLARTFVDVLVRVEHADGRVHVEVLKPTRPLMIVPAGAASRFATVVAYFRLGVEHILLGVDHLLFVLGLLLIVDNRRTLIETITAFTVAHSFTLAVATLGYASAPLPPLNAAIALSILCLGPEIARKWRGETSLAVRFPYLVAFGFGLLHGFGFASGLTTTGIPSSEIPSALLFFNVGVEVGQLAFVFLVIALQRSFRVVEMRWPPLIARAPAYAVGVCGAYWTIDRTVKMFTGALALSLLFPAIASAHVEHGAGGGFAAGLVHPISGADHVLAMVSVGLWGAQLGAPAIWLLPVAFPMVMALGGMLGLAGVALPGVEIGIALSAVALGLAVLTEARPPISFAAALVAFFAIFHGYAHGAELPPGSNGLLYSVGFVVATGALHATGIGIGLIHRWSVGRTVLRAAGGCVTAAGLLFLYRALE